MANTVITPVDSARKECFIVYRYREEDNDFFCYGRIP